VISDSVFTALARTGYIAKGLADVMQSPGSRSLVASGPLMPSSGIVIFIVIATRFLVVDLWQVCIRPLMLHELAIVLQCDWRTPLTWSFENLRLRGGCRLFKQLDGRYEQSA
jgi:hypothetical protein